MSLRSKEVRLKLVLVVALFAVGVRGASAQITASPSSIKFGMVAVNVPGTSVLVTIKNQYSYSVNLTGITFSLPEYNVYTGLPIQTIPAHSSVSEFGFIFLASQPGVYNGTINFNFVAQGQKQTVTVTATATAFTTTAVATLSTSSMNFGNLGLGRTSTAQTVTVTNTGGPDSIKISAVDAYYEPFAVTGPATPVTLAAGQSATYQVTFSPLIVGPTTATLTFCYNNLPCNAVDLTGTGLMQNKLAITNFPTFPYATQGFAYQANMAAVGGKPPYIFRITQGSMPAGLAMATNGAITGTVNSGDAVGNYAFTVQVQDSTMPKRQTMTANLNIVVDVPPGGQCNGTSVDVGGSSNPIVDLMQLGTGTYCPSGSNCSTCPFGENCQGGLYPDGSNTDPDPHHSDGVAIAQAIQPINGKYVMISLGESASQQPFEQLITEAAADPEVNNPNLVLVDGAEGGATANYWALKSSVYWTELLNYSLPFAGVTPDQVVAAWVSDVNSSTSASFPSDATTLQGNYESIAQNLLTFFPNIKMMFFSSINYTGYSNTTTLPEPQGFESAFGAKWAIEDQIDGNPALNYNSANGPVLAPWMGWSFYYWGNGLIPRPDGITWSCQDLNTDGLHPANPWGHIKISQYLLDWFKNSDLTTPWFVKSGDN